MRFRAFVLVPAVILGLTGCNKGGNDLTAPNGTVYLEIYEARYTLNGEHRVLDGVLLRTGEGIGFTLIFQGRGVVPVSKPVWASAFFVSEDGTEYQNKAMTYGPLLGVPTVVGSFHLSGGLLDFARQKPGQRIQMRLRFNNGLAGNGQVFSLIGFYIQL